MLQPRARNGWLPVRIAYTVLLVLALALLAVPVAHADGDKVHADHADHAATGGGTAPESAPVGTPAPGAQPAAPGAAAAPVAAPAAAPAAAAEAAAPAPVAAAAAAVAADELPPVAATAKPAVWRPVATPVASGGGGPQAAPQATSPAALGGGDLPFTGPEDNILIVALAGMLAPLGVLLYCAARRGDLRLHLAKPRFEWTDH